MRIVLSLLLFAHAIAHLPGFLVSWQLIASKPDLPYRTTILGGRIDVGTAGMRVIGVLWLLAGFTVALAAIYLFRNTDRAWATAWAAVGFSAVMTIVGWPDSRTGAVLNAVAIAFLAWITLARS